MREPAHIGSRPRKVVAFLVYPRSQASDVSVILEAAPDALPATVAIESREQNTHGLDVFTLFDDSDAPRFVTYVYRKTVAAAS
ncbi:hypothetical protein [Leifsonia sp. NPDC058230]|uniref:hypothetical protein n=1 Tax=Leifsonia sp. NPDC058230 TaxID=3346391 RepID=UPI0036DF9278